MKEEDKAYRKKTIEGPERESDSPGGVEIKKTSRSDKEGTRRLSESDIPSPLPKDRTPKKEA